MALLVPTSMQAAARCCGRIAAAVGACLAPGASVASQSALDPHGPQAAAIAAAWWIMLAGATAILLLVVGLALFACLRRGAPPARPERIILVGGLLFPLFVLGALLVYGSTLSARLADAPEPVALIELTGHQWWWQARHRVGGRTVVRGNEIRIPVGQPVRLELRSADVIHSFWVPSLAGKLDLVPGRVNRMTLRADRAGVYRGQCAEFCGTLHAHMRLLVIVMPPAEFARWMAADASPPEPPAEFAALGCAGCHAADAAPPRGPDLRGFAGRQRALGIDGPDPSRLAAWLQFRHGPLLHERFGAVAAPDADVAARIAQWLAAPP